MKFYVAHRTDVDPPTKIAGSSKSLLKDQMKECGDGTEFTLVLHDVKPNLANFCQAIMDVTELDAVEATDYVISHGQVREVK
jgi:hypothetical protein